MNELAKEADKNSYPNNSIFVLESNKHYCFKPVKHEEDISR